MQGTKKNAHDDAPPEVSQEGFYELRAQQLELQMQSEELRRAQTELEASRQKYFDLYDLAPVGYVALNNKGLILEANLTIAKMLGVAKGSLLKRNRRLSKFVFPEDGDLFYKNLRLLFDTGKWKVFDLRLVPEAGMPFWARMEATVSKNDSDGEPLCRLAVINITAQKETEEELRKSNDRLRLALNEALAGDWELDLASLKMRCSPKHAEIFGYDEPPAKCTLASLLEHVYPEDRARVERSCYESMATGRAWHDECRIVRLDKAVRWVWLKAHVLKNDQGTPYKMDGMICDITDRKKVEREKERLIELNQQLQKEESLGRMAGAITHHLNNKLHVVMGNIELAIDKLCRGKDAFRCLAEAKQGIRNASELSNLMMAYLGQNTGDHEPLDLCEICRRSLILLRAGMPEKRAVLQADFAASGPTVDANANQIQQVLTNLVANAWESFDRKGGTINLSVETVSAGAIPAKNRFPLGWQPQDKEYACLSVADDGCGMAAAEIKLLFEPFFTSKSFGRGMGLAVVQGIVKAHNGAVTVESLPERGSVFRVFLPVTAEKIVPKPEETSDGWEIEAGGTVLLVDDDQIVLSITGSILANMGFTVLNAKDGKEAVELFRQHMDEIRFVLSDLSMPGMDGWETLTELRRLAPRVRVILASGYHESQAMAGEHTELPQVFLGKPYRMDQLRSAINRVLADEGNP